LVANVDPVDPVGPADRVRSFRWPAFPLSLTGASRFGLESPPSDATTTIRKITAKRPSETGASSLSEGMRKVRRCRINS
jgi:hypothetical protein